MSVQKKLIGDILSGYDIISENRNFIKEALNLVKLSDTGYSNVKYDTDGTQNDSINKPLLDDIQAAAKSVGIVATITTAKTGHNQNVKDSKNISRHMNGTGLDVAILNGIGAGGATNANNGNAEFRALGYKLKDALVSMGYIWNTEVGHDKAVMWQTNTGGNHFNHLHISNRSGQESGEPTTSASTTTTSGATSGTDSSSTDSSSSFDSGSGGGGAYQFAKKIGGGIIKAMGIKESFNPSSFGDNAKISKDKILIPKGHNTKIKSPISGKIVNFISNKSCVNQIVIEFSNRDDSGYLEYCGITKPSVNLNERISHGDVLGTTNNNVTVTYYSDQKRKMSINPNEDDKPSKDKGIVSLFNRRKNNVDKDRDDSDTKHEPLNNTNNEYAKLFRKLNQNVKKSFYPSQKKVDENIERIKGLIK